MAIGSHKSAKMKSYTWITPKHIIDALGIFDLDPCTPDTMPLMTAHLMLKKYEDGLSAEWGKEFVWLNPPHGKETHKWMKKIAEHGHGIALIFARTETKMFIEYVWEKATSVLFLHGRIHFCDTNGVQAKRSSGTPSVLIAYGRKADEILRYSKLDGTYINTRNAQQNRCLTNDESDKP